MMTREEAIRLLCVEKSTIIEVDGNKGAEKMLQAYDMAIEALSAEVRPTGEWVQKDMYADRFCSECNYAVWDSEAEEYNFCPNCGAKMYKDGEDE